MAQRRHVHFDAGHGLDDAVVQLAGEPRTLERGSRRPEAVHEEDVVHGRRDLPHQPLRELEHADTVEPNDRIGEKKPARPFVAELHADGHQLAERAESRQPLFVAYRRRRGKTIALEIERDDVEATAPHDVRSGDGRGEHERRQLVARELRALRDGEPVVGAGARCLPLEDIVR